MIEPIVYFGTVNADEEIDWREANTIESPDDDEELETTPEDVIGMLGFDPLDYDDDGKLNREKMYSLFTKVDTLLGEVETKAKHPFKSSNLLVVSPEQISKDFIRRTEKYEKKWVKKAQDIFTRQGKEAVKNIEALTQKEVDCYIEKKEFNTVAEWEELIIKGGKGSGNFNHSGREGYVGGSSKLTDKKISTDDGETTIGKLLFKIAHTKRNDGKDKLYLSTYGEDRHDLLEVAVLKLKPGTYTINIEGRAAPSLYGEISSRYGVYAGFDVTEKFIRGMSIKYPERIKASLTLGLQEVIISKLSKKQKEIDGYIIRKALKVENDKPIICLDFDDTLFDINTEEPIKGSLDFVNSVVDIFDVQILSGRSSTKAGRDEMKQWFTDNDFPVDKIGFPEHKPSVDVMLDDRAITFTGTYPSVEELQDFIPWNKKELQIVYVTKGGPGSGNFGHAGRPGLVGGSGIGDGSKERKLEDIPKKFQSKNLSIETVKSGNNYFFSAKKITEEWFDVKDGIVAECTIVKDSKTSIYLSQVNSWSSGKGYGIEIVKAALSKFYDLGIRKASGYVVNTNPDGQALAHKLGGKIIETTKTGYKYEFNLKTALKQKSYTSNYYTPIITKAKKDIWTKEWLVLLEEMYPEIIALEGEEVMATMLGGVGIFDVENSNVRDFIDQWKLKLSFEIEDETQRLLKDNIATGMEIGESIPEITSRVRGLFEDMSTYRAQRIARTETIRASNYAAEESYRQSGVVTGKVWLVSSDERLCPWCSAMGKKFNDKHPLKLGENFASLGESLSYKDENGNKHTMDIDYTDIKAPPLHPHCRCCLTAAIDQTLYDEIMSEKKTFTLDELIGKGGKGSGNFGHSGREGRVGGSGLGEEAGGEQKEGSFFIGNLNKKEAYLVRQEIKKWVGDRKIMGLDSIYLQGTPRFLLCLKKDHIGNVKGILAFTEEKNFISIETFATVEKGHGKSIIQTIINRAAELNKGITLYGTPEARGFYRKLGMRENKGIFQFSPEECKVRKKSIENELSKLEPKNGIFCVKPKDIGNLIQN